MTGEETQAKARRNAHLEDFEKQHAVSGVEPAHGRGVMVGMPVIVSMSM